MDPANAIFSTAVLDAALRQALADYTQANPLAAETVLTLPGDGREIALDSLTSLLAVTEVWFPYDSTADEIFPPLRPRGFRLLWDDSSPILFLNAADGAQPQSGDEIRILYTKPHTIQNLDSASATTPHAAHEPMLVRGAAGLAMLGRAADLNETALNMAVSTPNYAALANRFLNQSDFGFYPWLYILRSGAQVRGEPFGYGWTLDRFDTAGGGK